MPGRKVFLKIINLSKEYRISKGLFGKTISRRMAVKSISLEIFAGECLALVGESGSGKTTLGRCLLRLAHADQGSVIFNGVDLLQMPDNEFRRFRPKFQMIFQNPVQVLNPRQSIGSCLKEPLRVWGNYRKELLSLRVQEFLYLVGLDSDMITRFPHELSAGQRQRVAIARALTTCPTFLVADEPTSSLDASLKRHIIDLLMDLRRRLGLTLFLISHDLAMVSHASDRIAVMYNGAVVEVAHTNSLIRSPVHPYTKLLVQAASNRININSPPNSGERLKSQWLQVQGQGCEFSDQCPWVEAICINERPKLRIISNEQWVACHLV